MPGQAKGRNQVRRKGDTRSAGGERKVPGQREVKGRCQVRRKAETRSVGGERQMSSQAEGRPGQAEGRYKRERILIERITLGFKLKASREGSK